MALPYPPPYQDRRTLAEHLCMGETTVDEYVADDLLPRPRKGKGIPLWEWDEVKVYIKNWPIAGPGTGKAVSAPGDGGQAERIHRAAQRTVSESAT